MSYSLKAERGQPPDNRRRVAMSWLRRGAVVATIIVAAHLDLQSWNTFVDWIFQRADSAEPLRTMGAPVIVERDGAITAYVLTARRQLNRRTRWWLRRLPTHSELQLDLWAFDGITAQPRWHRRVLAAREGSMSDMALLGVDGDIIWLYAHGLRAHRIDDGTAAVDVVQVLQSANAELTGKLVDSPRYYGLDRAGLYLTDADARQWRIDADDFSARPVDAVPAQPRQAVVPPADFTVSSKTAFMARGMDLGTNWLGLLSTAEAAKLNVPSDAPGAKKGALAQHMADLNTVNNLQPLHYEQRYRLWRARIEQVSAAPPDWPKQLPDNWGTRPRYSDYATLPEAPEFLGAGLLDRGSGRDPVWLLDPDSVLVLHRDKLGDDARLQLTRVAGPAGRVVWHVALPLSLVQSVGVIDHHAVLFGREYRAADPRVAHDPYHDADEKLLTLDLRDGSLHAFNIGTDGPSVLDPDTASRR